MKKILMALGLTLVFAPAAFANTWDDLKRDGDHLTDRGKEVRTEAQKDDDRAKQLEHRGDELHKRGEKLVDEGQERGADLEKRGAELKARSKQLHKHADRKRHRE